MVRKGKQYSMRFTDKTLAGELCRVYNNIINHKHQ